MKGFKNASGRSRALSTTPVQGMWERARTGRLGRRSIQSPLGIDVVSAQAPTLADQFGVSGIGEQLCRFQPQHIARPQNQITAVASLNSLGALDVACEGRVDKNFGDDCNGCEGCDLYQTNRKAGDIKNDVIDKFDLCRGCDEHVIHLNSLNLIKTRYKYVSNSTSVIKAIMLQLYGKRKLYLLFNNSLAWINHKFETLLANKTRLTRSKIAQNMGVPC